MSGATVSVNGKLSNGTLVSVGGVGYDDFHANLIGFLDGDVDTAQDVLEAARAAITPVTADSGFAAAEANVAAAFPPPVQTAPAGGQGEAPMGANGKPKRWVPPGVSKKTGKPYQGFWAEDRDKF